MRMCGRDRIAVEALPLLGGSLVASLSLMKGLAYHERT